MIFSSYINEGTSQNKSKNNSKSKLTYDRTGLLKDATRLVKSELGSTILPHTTFRIDKEYTKTDFIKGKCEFITIAHIRKSAEPYIGDQKENAKAILDMLNRSCDSINKKLPDGCRLIPKYKGNPSSDEEWDGWNINLTVPKTGNEFLKESYIGGDKDLIFEENIKESTIDEPEVLSFSGNNGGSYIQDTLYESYIQAKIDAEDRLAFALKESRIISESDYSNIRVLQEAKMGDKLKARWHKFVAFIKNMFAKFMESISNILLNEKSYLEKYKDIILKKKPKDNLEYSYTGNYEVGVQRIIELEVPLFEYEKYKDALEDEGDGALVNKLMSNKTGFSYTDGETLAEQFKGYFLNLDDGQKSGKFSELADKMTTMYNFCYNFNKIQGIVKADTAKIDESTRRIEKMINDNIAKNAQNNTQKPDNTGDENSEGEGKEPKEMTTVTPENESTINSFARTIFTEEEKPQKVNIKTTTDVSKAVGSTSNINKDDEKGAADNATGATEGKNSNDIKNAADKWIRVCSALIGAKLTACQQIADDYMKIIRAHVRSYVGSGKKNKEGDTSAAKGAEYKDKAADAKQKAADAQKNLDKSL